MLRQSNFSKRSGVPASDIVYLLMLWVWLKVDSVAMFSKDALLPKFCKPVLKATCVIKY
jgi:hypothetical protein